MVTTTGKDETNGYAVINMDDLLQNFDQSVKSKYYTALFRERFNIYKSLNLCQADANDKYNPYNYDY